MRQVIREILSKIDSVRQYTGVDVYRFPPNTEDGIYWFLRGMATNIDPEILQASVLDTLLRGFAYKLCAQQRIANTCLQWEDITAGLNCLSFKL